MKQTQKNDPEIHTTTDNSNKHIHLLDENTINKIAAGEVVERPSSVVKELVENAIDGGATSVVIEIENGGKKRILVSDNGSGIAEADIPLIFERHATSKINTLEDIYEIFSMGFRGEAMSSIAAIADVTLTTKHREEDHGNLVHIQGGRMLEVKTTGATDGTRVDVRDLFFNTPARQKFMKSDLSEQNSVVDIVEKLALFHMLISFKLLADGKLLFQTPGNGDMLAAIHTLFGKTKAKSLLPLEYDSEKVQIHGYISKPELTKGNSTDIIFAVNRRVVKNKTLVEAAKQAYKTMLMNNKYPLCFLNITTAAGEYDVNVHPAKAEVKFHDDKAMFSTVYVAMKNTLSQNFLMQEMEQLENLHEEKMDNSAEEQTALTMEPPSSEAVDMAQIKDEGIYADLPNEPSEAEQTNIANALATLHQEESTVPTYNSFHQGVSESTLNYHIKNAPPPIQEKPSCQTEPQQSKPQGDGELEVRVIGQLFQTYILCCDCDSYYMIDQHAAHERLIYETLHRQMTNGDVLVQNMLMPIVIDLTAKEMGGLMEHMEIFHQMGFEIEPFGASSIKISSVPLLLGQPCNGAVVYDLIENALDAKNNLTDLREKMIISMSCKNAIKAGATLGEDEMKHLVTQLFQANIPYTCPHGRPVILKMTKTEIEKKFKRIVS